MPPEPAHHRFSKERLVQYIIENTIPQLSLSLEEQEEQEEQVAKKKSEKTFGKRKREVSVNIYISSLTQMEKHPWMKMTNFMEVVSKLISSPNQTSDQKKNTQDPLKIVIFISSIYYAIYTGLKMKSRKALKNIT